jgi:hypothetical protein
LKKDGWLNSQMKNIYIKTACVSLALIVVFSLVPIAKTQTLNPDYQASFLLLSQPSNDKSSAYELNVTIPYSLHQYYTLQNHMVFSESDFAKFVTPRTLKPIADRLWQIYNNTEDYTNGVLEIVHQITYQETKPGRYAVETLAKGEGDCDLFAYVAASILEAGGIDCVLLLYKDQEHMELGVDVGYQPKDTRYDSIYSVTYQNVTYYVAECTGGGWRYGWRVGECPDKYQNVSYQVVPLTGMEQSSIGQVSANLRELDHSTLTMHVSSSLLLEDNAITISGQILPHTPNENVTLQAKINGGDWGTLDAVTTQSDGRFSYNWTPPVGGVIDVQASWLGNRQLNGASSTVVNVVVLPYFVLAVVASAAASAVVISLAFVRMRRKTPIATPQPSQATPQENQ